MSDIKIGEIDLANDKPLVLIGGVNVIESRDMALKAAETFVREAESAGLPLIFKASYDKANRSSIDSFRGPGLEEGLKILAEVKETFNVPVISDVHEIEQAKPAAEVLDILQIPAFLARQTDLVQAIARTGAIINVKKPQFLSPQQIGNIVDKIKSCGNDRIMVCERGSSFGYDNLVVDILGFGVMKNENDNIPLVFDVTHSLQQRSPGSKASGGRREQIYELARAGVAAGISALFLEAHEDPDQAKCDGPSALPFAALPKFLDQVKRVDELVKPMLSGN
ncbi:MAG: 3-deoxy-8-phosphooctulonate synthase [Alphaproteobacteria bacterium]|nr:3-deoxy-8-phosphooctulonate synthase [Alphaproteobacteria bacterium]MBO6626870.1 3-deoxy-8-phosphooctulonate synthase [Alphaproteobacteria bacterium]MDF1627557.1 3-deoxy-8-phosphooctulonate synthase [Parvibaculaceae bacterium]